MFTKILGDVFLTVLYITAILILLTIIYAVVTTPFRVRKQRKTQEELKEFFSEVIDETKETSKKAKNTKAKKE